MEKEFCNLKLVKTAMKIFNVFFWIAAVCLLVVAAWLRVQHSPLDPLLQDLHLRAGDIILLVASVIAIPIGVVGCFGVLREKKLLLAVFFGLLFVIFALHVACAIVTYYYYDEVEVSIQPVLNDTFYNRYHSEAKYEKAIDTTQERLECCGYESYSVFEKIPWASSRPTALPDSCCVSQGTCTVGPPGKPVQPGNVHKSGCLGELEGYAEEQLFLVGTLALGFTAVQLLGMIITCCLYKALTDTYDDPY